MTKKYCSWCGKRLKWYDHGGYVYSRPQVITIDQVFTDNMKGVQLVTYPEKSYLCWDCWKKEKTKPTVFSMMAWDTRGVEVMVTAIFKFQFPHTGKIQGRDIVP